VTRICSEGSAKIPKWVLPSMLELLRLGKPFRLLSLVVASWIFYLGKDVDQAGRPLTIIDARAEELTRLARTIRTDPRPIFAVRSIFGDDLPSSALFLQSIEKALQRLSTSSVPETLRFYLSEESTR
jgi:mannitol 2-dehydrogenase